MYVISALLVALVIVVTRYSLQRVQRSDEKAGLTLSDENYSITGTLKNMFRSQEGRIKAEEAVKEKKKRREDPEQKKASAVFLAASIIPEAILLAVCAFTAPAFIPLPVIMMAMTLLYHKGRSDIYFIISVGTAAICTVISVTVGEYPAAAVSAVNAVLAVVMRLRLKERM